MQKDMSKFNSMEDTVCAFPSGYMEFCEIASEAWFFCLAVDLLYSFSNPFSSLKNRLKYYHSFSWSFAFIFAIVLGASKSLHGFWSIAGEAGDSMFCWIKDKKEIFTYKPLLFLYIPLASVYFYAFFILLKAFKKLKSGISKTFRHRIRVLFINSTNIIVFFIYWTIIGLIYLVLSMVLNSSPTDASNLFRVLLFCLSAKGVADLAVWVLIMDASGFKVYSLIGINVKDESSIEDEDDLPDLTQSLRKEVLEYATTGIKQCTITKGITDDHASLRLHLTQMPNGAHDTVQPIHIFSMILNLGTYPD